MYFRSTIYCSQRKMVCFFFPIFQIARTTTKVTLKTSCFFFHKLCPMSQLTNAQILKLNKNVIPKFT